MTISNTVLRTSAVGAGAVLEIPYQFATSASGDLLVIERVIATGVETELTENAASDGYTATYDSSGGTVTTSDSIAATSQVHVIQNLTRTQTLDLVQGGSFNAENIETALDKNNKIANENRDRIDRLIRFPQTDPSASVVELPNSVDRAGKYLYFGDDGEPTTAGTLVSTDVTVSTFMETVLDDADADAARNTLGGSAQFEAGFYTDFSTAISTIGATVGELHIRTTLAIVTNETVPATLTLVFHRGGSLSVSGSKTVTINGDVRAGLYKIFTLDTPGWATDKITFMDSASRGLKEVYPQWFGAVGDGSTDDTAAFHSVGTSVRSKGCRISIPKGDYVVKNWHPHDRSYYVGAGMMTTRFIGDGEDIIRLTSNAITGSAHLRSTVFENIGFHPANGYSCINTYANGADMGICTFKKCSFEVPSTTTAGTYALEGYIILCKFDDCFFGYFNGTPGETPTANMTSAIYFTHATNTVTSNQNLFSFCKFYGCSDAAIDIGSAGGSGYNNTFFACDFESLEDKLAYLKNADGTKFRQCWIEDINETDNSENCVFELSSGMTNPGIIVDGLRLVGAQNYTDKVFKIPGATTKVNFSNSYSDYNDTGKELVVITLQGHDQFWSYGNHILNASADAQVSRSAVDDQGYRYYRETSVADQLFYEGSAVSYENESIYYYTRN